MPSISLTPPITVTFDTFATSIWTMPSISLTPPITVTFDTFAPMEITAATTDLGPLNEVVLHRSCRPRGTVHGTDSIIRPDSCPGSCFSILNGDAVQRRNPLQYCETKTYTETQRHGGSRVRSLHPPFSRMP